jgi:hypothetical protein
MHEDPCAPGRRAAPGASVARFGFDRWGRGLREVIVAAMIDRLFHHAEVITSMVVRELSLMEISGGSAQQRLDIPTRSTRHS